MLMLQDKFDLFQRIEFRELSLPGEHLPKDREGTSVPNSNSVATIRPELAQAVADGLRFGSRPMRTKQALVEAYVADCDRLNQTSYEFRDFLHSAIFSSLIYGGEESPTGDVEVNTLSNATDILASSLDDCARLELLPSDGELVASNTEEELHDVFLSSLQGACYSITDSIFDTLQAGFDRFLFGGIQPLVNGEDGNSTGLRYCYFTRRVRDEFRQARYRDEACRQLDNAMHVHDIVNPVLGPLPAPQVPKPNWLMPFLDTIPRWLKAVPGAVSILSGAMVYEQVMIRSNHTETQDLKRSMEIPKQTLHPWHTDPAIVIANTWVLTGWGELDLKSRSPFRGWIPDLMPKQQSWDVTSPSVEYYRKKQQAKRTGVARLLGR